MEFEHLRYTTEMDSLTFDELMKKHGRDVWNYAYFLNRRRDLADDISQDVFLQVYRNLHRFRGGSTVKTWLLKITRNISYNYRRSAFIRRVTLLDHVSRDEATRSAEEDFIDRTASDEIWKAVLSLPVKYREVLLLDIEQGMSMKEMAELLGVSEGTVKSRLHRSRSKVSGLLKEVVSYERV